MKIAFLRFSTVFGGVESHIFSLARSLKAEGHDPVLVFRDGSLVESARNEGLTAVFVRKRFKLDIFFLARLWRCLKRIQPEIVHSHGILSDFCGALLLPRLPGKNARHVITIHSLPWIGFGLGRLKAHVYKKMHTFSIKRAVKIITVSEWLKKEVFNQVPSLENRLEVIYNGIDRTRFEPYYALRRNREKKRNGNIVIGFAGRLSEEKGVSIFIRAFSFIIEHYLTTSGIEGKILGDGRERRKLEKQIIESGLSGQVELMGFRKDVEPILSNFDIFVLPSIIEGFPLILLEVGALGIPVVATKA